MSPGGEKTTSVGTGPTASVPGSRRPGSESRLKLAGSRREPTTAPAAGTATPAGRSDTSTACTMLPEGWVRAAGRAPASAVQVATLPVSGDPFRVVMSADGATL